MGLARHPETPGADAAYVCGSEPFLFHIAPLRRGSLGGCPGADQGDHDLAGWRHHHVYD